jgi:hypothetical protein
MNQASVYKKNLENQGENEDVKDEDALQIEKIKT